MIMVDNHEHSLSEHRLHNEYLRDIDPDENFLNVLRGPDSKYYDENEFNAMRENIPTREIEVSFIHLNARSLKKNFDAMEQSLHCYQHSFSVIGVSETWHTDATVDCYDMHRYSCIHSVRRGRRGGGVTFYISTSLSFKERTDLTLSTATVDHIFVELNTGKKKIVVGLIYRPPDSDQQEFITDFSTVLHAMRAEKRACFLMGDFNIDLMRSDAAGPSHLLLDTLYSHGFYPLITKPTRIDDQRGSAT